MKTFKYILLIVAVGFFVSCSSDDDALNDNTGNPIDDITDLNYITSFEDANYSIDLYLKNHEDVQLGYNHFYVQLKDGQDNFVNNAELTWRP